MQIPINANTSALPTGQWIRVAELEIKEPFVSMSMEDDSKTPTVRLNPSVQVEEATSTATTTSDAVQQRSAKQWLQHARQPFTCRRLESGVEASEILKPPAMLSMKPCPI